METRQNWFYIEHKTYVQVPINLTVKLYELYVLPSGLENNQPLLSPNNAKI